MNRPPDLFQTEEFDARRFLQKLEAFDREIPSSFPADQEIPRRILTPLLGRVREVSGRLAALARAIDPVRHHDIYDPSHPEAAADLIARKLILQDRRKLLSLEAFWGSGIYAIYYTGNHPAYARISGREIPIYVGKADPDQANATEARQQGQRLFARLREHARTIRSAESYADSHPERTDIHPIRLAEFECRFLVLASAFAGAVEIALIRHYEPVWNREMGVCIGFGKHGDKAETRTNTRSDWDTIHPGRTWATREENIPNPRTVTGIQADIIRHLEEYPDFLP